MIYDKAYSIPFVGLSEGLHYFDYHIDAGFFEEIEYSPIGDSAVEVDLAFNKHSNFFELNFDLNGTVNVQCDRCLEFFDLPITNQFQLIVKFDDISAQRKNRDESEIKYIPNDATEINVAQPIYEYINLSLPMQQVHPNHSCDNKVTEVLEKLSPEQSEGDKIDPRWEKLKKIKQRRYGSS